MNDREPERRTRLPIPAVLVVGLLVVFAAIGAFLGYPLLSSASQVSRSSPSAGSSRPVPSQPGLSSRLASSPRASSSLPAASTIEIPRRENGRPLRQADGILPDRVTVLDDQYPGIANLDPDLLRALRRAATDAADGGVELFVESGWRSPEYQDRLLREAVSKHGSVAEAARWVATPATSPHVSGEAADIGPFDAIAWLSEHGSKYGVCQIYRNEPWHYELRAGATDHGCPRMYADPTHDPRMQR